MVDTEDFDIKSYVKEALTSVRNKSNDPSLYKVNTTIDDVVIIEKEKGVADGHKRSKSD